MKNYNEELVFFNNLTTITKIGYEDFDNLFNFLFCMNGYGLNYFITKVPLKNTVFGGFYLDKNSLNYYIIDKESDIKTLNKNAKLKTINFLGVVCIKNEIEKFNKDHEFMGDVESGITPFNRFMDILNRERDNLNFSIELNKKEITSFEQEVEKRKNYWLTQKEKIKFNSEILNKALKKIDSKYENNKKYRRLL